MLGQYDGLAILDLPDSAAAARLAMTVSSTGAFTHLETHELFSAEQVLQLLKGADRRRVRRTRAVGRVPPAPDALTEHWAPRS
jgi:hypothetical protein